MQYDSIVSGLNFFIKNCYFLMNDGNMNWSEAISVWTYDRQYKGDGNIDIIFRLDLQWIMRRILNNSYHWRYFKKRRDDAIFVVAIYWLSPSNLRFSPSNKPQIFMPGITKGHSAVTIVVLWNLKEFSYLFVPVYRHLQKTVKTASNIHCLGH